MGGTEIMVRLAKALPDISRYVETRAMLLMNRADMFGLEQSGSLNFVVRNVETDLLSVIGKPPIEALYQAVEAARNRDTLLAFQDNVEYVREAMPERNFERAILHVLPEAAVLPDAPPEMVRFLSSEEIEALAGVPADLKKEILIEAKHTPIAATVIDERPVSFCYAGAVTERLWDVSIDTLEGYRKQGYAGMCVAFLVEYFARHGKRPVWGAMQSNRASLKLAEKLGFVPDDELLVSERRLEKD